MNKLYIKFAECVANCDELRMVINTDEKDGVGEPIYWLVDFNDTINSNKWYFGGDEGNVVAIFKCFTDKCEHEFYQYATYEEGWAKVKELAKNATEIHVEGY